jgi:hypothetical protein
VENMEKYGNTVKSISAWPAMCPTVLTVETPPFPTVSHRFEH